MFSEGGRKILACGAGPLLGIPFAGSLIGRGPSSVVWRHGHSLRKVAFIGRNLGVGAATDEYRVTLRTDPVRGYGLPFLLL